MAKLYGEILASALMTFDKSFARSNGQPLDSTEVFYSLAAAEEYAATAVAYVGQKIVVVETVDGATTVTHYGIEADNSLKELGTSPVGDESTITVAEDGTVSLAGISGLAFTEKNEDGEDVTVTYQPLLTSGGLTWVKPSATTVEGLATEIEGLKGRLDVLEDDTHTHANKELLDTYAQTEEDLADAVAKKHAHENIDELKLIASGDKAKWDTAAADVAVIKGDYLVEADKTELTGAIATAKSEAISEAVAAVLGEGVNEDFDTLKEVADWILSDTSGAASLITRISSIEADYLKGEDQEALEGEIDALGEFVGSLPEGASSASIVDYIQEVVDGLNIGALEDKVSDLEDVESEKNVINTVDETYFEIGENRQLTLKDLMVGKITGLQDALDDKADKGTTLAEYGITDAYTKAETEGRIQEVMKGLSDTSETAASVSQALETYKVSNDARVLLVENKLVTVEEGAQVNKIDGVSGEFEISAEGKILSVKEIAQSKVTGLTGALEDKVGKEDGKSLISENLITKIDALDIATADTPGLVKSSSVDNGVVINDDGTMEVYSFSLNKLVQPDGVTLVLDGGDSSVTA